MEILNNIINKLEERGRNIEDQMENIEKSKNLSFKRHNLKEVYRKKHQL
jgi:hypothetical protein